MRRGSGGKTLSQGKDPRAKGESQSCLFNKDDHFALGQSGACWCACSWFLFAEGQEEKREFLGTRGLSESDQSPERQGVPWADTHAGWKGCLGKWQQ